MLDDLLNFVLKATEVAPRYTSSRCLAVTQSRNACSVCVDICPHEAVTIRRHVEIDPVDCTGCGLCVQGCPSQALEPSLRYRPGLPVRCSKVPGAAQSVTCLGRLQPSDLLRLAGTNEEVRLARGDCGTCPIGGAAILDALEVLEAEAADLAALHERPFRVTVLTPERFDETGASRRMSRRDLLRGGLREIQRGAAEALAPLDPGGDVDRSLPRELQRAHRVIESADLPDDALVPWRLPRVDDACILCPICTRVCPTTAIVRRFDEDGTATLYLEPERCVDCDACVVACPVDAVQMDDAVRWGELSGGEQIAFARDPQDADAGPTGSIAR